MAPPGMNRLAQTMSQPPRASSTMRSSIAALVSSSAGYISTNGARLAANPVITALCAPRPRLRTNSTGRPAWHRGLARIAGSVSSSSWS